MGSCPRRTDLEWQMLDLVNQEGPRAGVAPLQMDSKLVEIARLKSQDMIDKITLPILPLLMVTPSK